MVAIEEMMHGLAVRDVAPIQSLTGVNHAAIPNLANPRVTVQTERASVLSPGRDPNCGIALRVQPATKVQFQVDDCGNAWRVAGRGERIGLSPTGPKVRVGVPN
jgi:hypothetical protein